MSKSMDRAVITAFAKAILETFQTMLGLEVQARQARDKEERIPGDGVHAIIGMNGEVEGACALTLPRDTALRMYQAMIGEEIKEVDAMVVDAVQGTQQRADRRGEKVPRRQQHRLRVRPAEDHGRDDVRYRRRTGLPQPRYHLHLARG